MKIGKITAQYMSDGNLGLYTGRVPRNLYVEYTAFLKPFQGGQASCFWIGSGGTTQAALNNLESNLKKET